MGVQTVSLTPRHAGDTQIENMTKSVADALAGTGLLAGIVTVFVKHTTASVMIIEDEPGIRADTKTFWDRLVPPDPTWQHNTAMPVRTTATATSRPAARAVGHHSLSGRGAAARGLAADCARRFRYQSQNEGTRLSKSWVNNCVEVADVCFCVIIGLVLAGRCGGVGQAAGWDLRRS